MRFWESTSYCRLSQIQPVNREKILLFVLRIMVNLWDRAMVVYLLNPTTDNLQLKEVDIKINTLHLKNVFWLGIQRDEAKENHIWNAFKLLIFKPWRRIDFQMSSVRKRIKNDVQELMKNTFKLGILWYLIYRYKLERKNYCIFDRCDCEMWDWIKTT